MLKKTLVIYHSAQGNTEKVAKEIASEIQCDLIKINKEDVVNPSRIETASKIIKQLLQRNKFKHVVEKIDLSSYERIYIGSPCWFYTYTPPIGQFLKRANYRDKEIILFLTHGGGPRSTVEKFKEAMNGGTFIGDMDFLNVNSMEKSELKKQVKTHLKRFQEV
jgi:flavodoxin